MDAALALFVRDGLTATSIHEICERSGASVGSVYHHFGSKEGIAQALYVEAIVDYQVELVAMLDGCDDARSGIVGIVTHFLRWVGDHPDRARLMLASEFADLRRSASAEITRLNRAMMQQVGEWFRRFPRAFPDVPEDVMLALVVGPAERFARAWIAKRTTTSIADAADSVGEFTWQGLRGLRRTM